MAFAEVESIEHGEPNDSLLPCKVKVIYRVRVCTRCKHPACQYCNGIFCDDCLESGPCSEDLSCVYDEPDDQAVTEVSRHVLTKEELEELDFLPMDVPQIVYKDIRSQS